MTTSPYDNLPTGKKEEVIPEAQETSLNKNVPQQPEQLHYVDVDPEEILEPAPAPEPVKTPDPAKTPVPAKAPEPAEMPEETDAPGFAKMPQAVDAPGVAKMPQAPKAPEPAPIHMNDPSVLKQAPLRHAPASPKALAKTVPFEKEPQYTSVHVRNMRCIREYILPFEESLLVPDSMPDMEHLLFAEGSVHLAQTGKQHYGKDDFLSGDITVYTVYQPSTGSGSPVDVVKSIIPFKTDKCWSGVEGSSFCPEVTIKSISAGKINERKFSVKGELRIRFTEITDRELKVLSGSEDDDLVRSERDVRITDLDFEMEETTEINQDINIRENQPSPAKILKTSIRITENHRQITSGKLVINATIHSQILYIGEEAGNRELCCLTNKTDFTMFALMKKQASPDLIRISFCSDDLTMTIENQNQFLLSGKVTALICGYQNRTVKTVSDAYHKQQDIKFDVITQELSAVKDIVSGVISAREVIDLSAADERPEKLLCGYARPPVLECRPEKGRLVIEGSMPVTILALDESEKPFILEASLPLRGSLETSAAGDDLTTCITTALKDFWFDEINSRQLEINVSLSINVWITGAEVFCSLENMCFVENSGMQRAASMAVYVTGSHDTLWDVAKRYKSDVDAIARLNQIDPLQPLPEGTKLLVTR